MNIVITGSYGVGKTELFESVGPELGLDFLCVDDIDIGEEQSSKSFYEYMYDQEFKLTERVNRIKWNKNFVTEHTINGGSILDELACMIVGKNNNYEFAYPGNIKNNIDILKNTSQVVMKAIDFIHEYDLIFYIPIESDYKVTSRRAMSSRDELHQAEVDKVLKYILTDLNLYYLTITGSVDERTKTVLDVINAQIKA